MKIKGLVAACALVLGACGGPSGGVGGPHVDALSASLPAGLGPVRFAAWQVEVAPAGLASGLRALDARMGAEPDALGPLSVAWLRARAALVDLLSDVAPKGAVDADLLAAWGLVPDAPLRFSLGASGGTEAGRHLLAVAAGLSEAAVTTPLWHARLQTRVHDAATVETSLYTLASSLHWGTLNPRALPAAFGEPAPANVFWMAYAADQGLVLLARRHVDVLVIDLIAGTGDLEPATIWAWLQADGGQAADSSASLGAAPAHFLIDFAGLAALEVALNVASTLAPRPGATAAMRQSLAEAGAALTASCVDRWQRTADLAETVRVDFDPGAAVADDPARPAVAIEVQLTPEGAAAWRHAARWTPLAHLGGWPAAWQLGLAGAEFPPFDSHATGFAGWLQARGCSAGDPSTLALGALVFLPALLEPQALPRPQPPAGDAANLSPVFGAAAAVVGVREGLGTRGLGMVGLQQGTVIATESPLGPAARPEAGGGTELQAPGQAPVIWRLRPATETQAAVTILGLGQGAADELQARLRSSKPMDPVGAEPSAAGAEPGAESAQPDGLLFAEARLDAGALAAALTEVGEAGVPVATLRAVGSRLGPWRLAATFLRDQLRVTLGPEKHAAQAGHHLDVRLGAK